MAAAAPILAANVVPEKPKLFTKLVHGTHSKDYKLDRAAVIADPAILTPKLKFIERTEFLQSLTGEFAFDLKSNPLTLDKLPKKFQGDIKASTAFHVYGQLQATDARLPKFSKWLSSVYPDFKELHNAVALAMTGNQADTLIIATDAMSMYNGGNTPFFYTCLATAHVKADGTMIPQGSYLKSMHGIMDKMEGISIAYILDRKTGFMKGRIWMHHVRHPEFGDAVFLGHGYGCLKGDQVAAVFKAQFPNVIVIGNDPYGGGASTNWQFVGYPKDSIPEWHWDTVTVGRSAQYLTHPNAEFIGKTIG